MNVVFVSNYYNHHQDSLSKALYNLTHGHYVFLQTMEMEEERKGMGWGIELPEYVCKCYTQADEEKYRNLIHDADVVICGSARDESILRQRMLNRKLTFRYSERIYKKQW